MAEAFESSESDSDSDISSISGLSDREINFESDGEEEFVGFGEIEGGRQYAWSKDFYEHPNVVPDFTGNSGPSNPLPGDATALDYFQKFIDDDLLNTWIAYTHEHATKEITEHPQQNKSMKCEHLLPF